MTQESPERDRTLYDDQPCPVCGVPFAVRTLEQARLYIIHLQNHLKDGDTADET